MGRHNWLERRQIQNRSGAAEVVQNQTEVERQWGKSEILKIQSASLKSAKGEIPSSMGWYSQNNFQTFFVIII
jgi:hypothetical protein